jgi:glucosamine-6-phosphate deaminase
MQVDVSSNPARRAADRAIASLKRILAAQETARLLVATGNSQIQFLKYLTTEPGIDWQRVELFHLDEYIGIGETHPASFARYVRSKVITPNGMTRYHLLDGLARPVETIERTGSALTAAPIDLAFAGIGENGHLAFNDPPADFETEDPYLLVTLDEPCRWQQVGEGWFETLFDVPKHALTISVRQLLKAQEIISVVPDARKAKAVAACLDGEISPQAPASALRLHSNARIYLDPDSAAETQVARQFFEAIKLKAVPQPEK